MNVVIPKAEMGRDAAVTRLAKVLCALDPLKAWDVSVVEKKPRRSEQQNRYLWGVCYAELCKHLPGWDAEDVHEYMLGEWSGWEALEGLGRKRLRPLRRSSRLNKQEFADFVDFIQRKAAEHGVFIPDPQL
jgi:hypothetical protein